MAEHNILQSFFKNVQRYGRRDCLRFKRDGRWQALSWNDAEARVADIALGLSSLGIQKGDAVAIFSSTNIEWTLADLAILSLGAVTVPVYQSNTPDQAAFILQDSEAKVAFVENAELQKRVLSRRKELPALEKLILFSGPAGKRDTTMSLGDLQELGTDEDLKAWKNKIDHIQPKDIATIVYTSGTTGNPKGAVLSHGNFAAEIAACRRLFDIDEKHVGLIFLPLAHILARMMQFYQICIGYTQAYAESIDKLVDNMGEVRPHFFAGVPRIFEKVYERVLNQVESGSPLKKAVFTWGTAVGSKISARKQVGKSAGPVLAVQGALASFLVFRKLKKRLGGRLRYALCGGAPLSKDIAEFFHAAGILIVEGYGLTETSAAINCNTPDHYKFGTVGKAVEGAEEKIAEDGEILVRGPLVFQGYYKNPEATRQVLDFDGWFKTGDIGEFDAEGFLRITDRKKDIIVTAAGKNIAPQNIENLLKTVPFISQVMVHGDRRKYLAALVTLSREPIEEFARKERITYDNFGDLTKHPKIFSLVRKAIDEKNKILASYESIKRFAILESDFTQETGELTPTLKVKRKFVSEKYGQIIDQLYQE